jgi:hypothetical protein
MKDSQNRRIFIGMADDLSAFLGANQEAERCAHMVRIPKALPGKRSILAAMHAAVHNNFNLQCHSFLDGRCGSSEPKRQRNGKAPLQRREL